MANRYWVGGTADWDTTAGTKWALTSGGGGGQAVPTSSDDVFFDDNSGANTITLTATGAAKTFTCTGFTGTFAGGSTLQVYGNVILGSGMTWTQNSNLNIRGGVSANFTSNGVTIACKLLILDADVTLLDNFSSTNNTDWRKGSLNANNFNVTIQGLDRTTTDNNFTLSMGSGTWTITGSGSITGNTWDLVSTNTTVNAETSTIKFTNNSSGGKVFKGGGKTYYNVWNATAGTGVFTIKDSNTFNNIKIDAGRTTKFTDETTQTVSSFTAIGTSGSKITLGGTSTGGWTISDSTGINTVEYCNISYSTATGGATWKALTADGNTDDGNNSGWDFRAVSTGNFFQLFN